MSVYLDPFIPLTLVILLVLVRLTVSQSTALNLSVFGHSWLVLIFQKSCLVGGSQAALLS